MSSSLGACGHELYVAGTLFGLDRVEGATKRGHGDDRVVAFGTLLEVAGELAGGAGQLLTRNLMYAAGALLRQLVEVEYLLWAFSNDEGVAREWLQADRATLLDVFSPAAIRKRANRRFNASEYETHCNFGGHPSPSSVRLLAGHGACLPVEAFWADLATHLERVWDRSIDVWKELLVAGAFLREPPTLRAMLLGEVGLRHDHIPESQPDLLSCKVNPDTGRIMITVASSTV